MTPKFSIRSKFLIVISSLLLICIAAYLSIALHTFREDKTALVFDLNHSVVSGIASEIETTLTNVKGKLELFAWATAKSADSKTPKEIENLLLDDSRLIFLELVNRSLPDKKSRYVRKEFFETYSISQEYLDQLLKKFPVPYDEILEKGHYIWSLRDSSLPPLIGIGKAVIHEDDQHNVQNQYAVFALVRLDQISASQGLNRLHEVFLTRSDGALLFHTNTEVFNQNLFVTDWPMVSQSKNSPASNQIMRTKWQEHEVMGGFAKSKDRMWTAFAMVEESKAFSALQDFLKRSLLFTSIIATLALIAAILFSRNLTRPLEKLVEGMVKVGHGELNTKIEISSNDETLILANSFNQMISDLRDSRHQLEEINLGLEQKVKDRTQELAERNLAVKEAQEALIHTTRLASVGEIAARAAHEVLNPLTGIMTRLTIVQKRTNQHSDSDVHLLSQIIAAWKKDFDLGGFELLIKNWQEKSQFNQEISLFQEDLDNFLLIVQGLMVSDTQIREDLGFLAQECQRISKIVQTMRSLSHVQCRREEQSLHSLIQESTVIMMDLLEQKNIKVEMKLDASIDTIWVDRDEFLQSLTNLLRNSIQAIESHPQRTPGLISIQSGLDEKHIWLELHDNGIGIDAENTTRLFESQFSTKPKEEGTGLGLSIARRFIRSFGGDIVLIKSFPLTGATFRISLPRQSLQSQETAA